MANIQEFLQAILAARYGKDVRQSIHDAIDAINVVNEENIGTVQNIAEEAQGYATDASDSATTAQGYATNAATSATEASTSEDNAERYYQQTRSIAESLGSALVPQGTVTFANLPSLANVDKDGYMWNISDSFVTTSDFVEGAGVAAPMGSNVYKITLNGVAKWDILAGSAAEVFTGTTAEVEQALQDGRLNEDMMINITDDDSGDDVLDANQIEYDNTTSGLDATSTQNAIDEVKGLVDDNTNAIEDIYSDLIHYESKSASSSLNPSSNENMQFTYTIPNGYRVLGITPKVNNGAFSCALSNVTDSIITMRVFNHSTQGSAEAYTVSIEIAYVKVSS